MTELEIFAKMTIEQGGIWIEIARTENSSHELYKTQTSYEYQYHIYYNSPVYQIFDRHGKRVFASLNYHEAMNHLMQLGGADND